MVVIRSTLQRFYITRQDNSRLNICFAEVGRWGADWLWSCGDRNRFRGKVLRRGPPAGDFLPAEDL